MNSAQVPQDGRSVAASDSHDLKKMRRYRLIPLIRVEGGHYKLKCCRMLFIRRPLRVVSVADSEPTAGSRYPSLHLQTLPSRVSCPRCIEAVIHSNATRNKLKSGQSVRTFPPGELGWETRGKLHVWRSLGGGGGNWGQGRTVCDV